MQQENETHRPHPLRTEAFIRDLATVEINHSTEWAPAPPPPRRGIGYHLRWIVFNIVLIAVGAYTFTHYLTERVLGPGAEVSDSAQSDSAP